MKQKICIVMSTYNKDITNKIYVISKIKLKSFGIKNIDLIKVPGAFEIPVAISKLIKKYDGFIAIGCIIKGETANFDLISRAITDGIMQLSISHKKPIGNSIITSFNRPQAEARLEKGIEAVTAVLEVLKIK